MRHGRKKDSGVISGINPQRESWTDIRNRIIYDSAEWPLVGLLATLRAPEGDGAKVAGNYLSARKSDITRLVADKKYVSLDKIDWFWNTLSARFERAVLDGDADWFERQAKALRSKQSQEKINFNA